MAIASCFAGTSGIIESSKRFPETRITGWIAWKVPIKSNGQTIYQVDLHHEEPIKVTKGITIKFRLRFRQGREEGFPTIPAQVIEVKGNKITLHLKSLPDPILEV